VSELIKLDMSEQDALDVLKKGCNKDGFETKKNLLHCKILMQKTPFEALKEILELIVCVYEGKN
jgi:hypothetical protein